jgi:cyclopropane fatty-acyl-phospholipid synthase-like methyltransferase
MLKKIKQFYRQAVPISIRSSPIIHKIKALILRHEWIYDAEYYEDCVDGPAVASARIMARSIFSEFAPKSVLDVGCGTGALLSEFQKYGCETFGLEFSPAGLEMCRQRGLNVKKFDLESERGDMLSAKYDIVTSMEVAEHLPEKTADSFVDLLCNSGEQIVFTAAHPGQGGSDHVNEQPQTYWVDKFLKRGYTHRINLSEIWRNDWKTSGQVANWYYENIMVFVKEN